MKNVTKLKTIIFGVENNCFEVDMVKLVRETTILDFSPVYESSNPDCVTDIFINLTQGLILSNSLEYRLPRNNITTKPWITSGLLCCICINYIFN